MQKLKNSWGFVWTQDAFKSVHQSKIQYKQEPFNVLHFSLYSNSCSWWQKYALVNHQVPINQKYINLRMIAFIM